MANSKPTKLTMAGNIVDETKTGHKFRFPSTFGKPSMLATNIPSTIVNWFRVPTLPLKFCGGSSFKYKGSIPVKMPQ